MGVGVSGLLERDQLRLPRRKDVNLWGHAKALVEQSEGGERA